MELLFAIFMSDGSQVAKVTLCVKILKSTHPPTTKNRAAKNDDIEFKLKEKTRVYCLNRNRSHEVWLVNCGRYYWLGAKISLPFEGFLHPSSSPVLWIFVLSNYLGSVSFLEFFYLVKFFLFLKEKKFD